MISSSLVIVVPELLPVPPVQGGAVEHWVDEASRRMLATGRKLTVVSRPAGSVGHHAIEYIGIPWTRMERFFSRIKDYVTWKSPLRYLAKIQNVYSYGQRVAKVVRDFDIVYLHNEPNILLFLRKRTGQKIVLHMHNDHLSMRLFRPLYRRALTKVDRVICVSDYIRRQAVSHFPEFADKFSVVFNATDPDIFKPYGDEAECQLKDVIRLEQGKKYLLYVGRLSPVKGVHVLIEAFSEIHRRMPDVHLIIAGSSFFGGAAKTAYEQQLVDLAESVSDAIIFTGYLPHQKLKYLYSIVDMVVLSSVWQDPCPLVVLESMASGTCLVSSSVGGIPEIVENGITGILVEPANPELLATAICMTLGDTTMLKEMESNARQKIISGYTWERLVCELENLFGSLK
ncbi:MAG: group 1 glycosyl transferase [Methylotenera sp.]|nr:MAG: group 1 glycosyl transferase [Methylotenera sp.]